ncbi:MAG: sulfatase-like hydrolase/transferase [bacterium]|nr:sulfatase-like hydrolase/transferase [bacterium]
MTSQPISQAVTARIFRCTLFLPACLVVLMMSGCFSPQSPLDGILLITVSSLRTDSLGCYGNTLAETPHLDRLARQGLLFKDVWSPAANSAPAFFSILTGKSVSDITKQSWKSSLLAPFKKFGWETMLSVSEPIITDQEAGQAGVDVFFSCVSKNVRFYRAKMNNDRVKAWLENRKGDRPLFCWVHYSDPAVPYDPPSPFFEFFCSQLIDDFPTDMTSPDFKSVFRDYMWLLYLAEVSYMDRQLGRLLDSWRETFRTGNSVIVVASLHGESFGENGIFFEPGNPNRETVSVPLIINGNPITQGTVEDVVSLTELIPALQKLANLPETGEEGPADGPLSMNLITNGSVHSTNGSPEALSAAPGAWSFRYGQWHYVLYNETVTYNDTDNYYTNPEYRKTIENGTSSLTWLGGTPAEASPTAEVRKRIDARFRELVNHIEKQPDPKERD